MKIVFICVSLEKGKDGVGDYTRRFSSELIKQGHEVAVAAFNDRHVTKMLDYNSQEDRGQKITTVRMSSKLHMSKRLIILSQLVNKFRPDWISLQYVPYGYQSRGLTIGLASRLKTISGAAKWHIMFHELWIGRDTIKNKLISILQEYIITQLLKILKPQIIHTHLPTFFKLLTDRGFDVNRLPLFSAINPSGINKEDCSLFTVTFFSQASSAPSVLIFLYKLNQELLKSNKRLNIVFIGGNHQKMRDVGEAIREVCPDVNITFTGHLDEEKVSKFLFNCNLGITSTPLHALGKSSSVAAFISHGIPIAVPIVDSNQNPSEVGYFSSNLNGAIVEFPDLYLFEEAKKNVLIAREEIKVSKIASLFLTDIGNK